MKRIIKVKKIVAGEFIPATRGEKTKSRIDFINEVLKQYLDEIKVGDSLEIEGSAFSGKLCIGSLGLAYTAFKAPWVLGSLMIDLNGTITTELNYRREQKWKIVKKEACEKEN